MAESCAVAFGRYLRTLRERSGLSLDDVESLSRAFPDPINKGYLSRCENGRQRLAFSKLIPLNRIYEVPSEVFIERMELDLELDRVGGPKTEGLSFEELTEKGKDATVRGRVWDGLAFLRDALPLAHVAPVRSDLKDALEQSLCALMNYTIAVGRLGRHQLGLHELEYVSRVHGLGVRSERVLLELLSQRHRALGHRDEARAFADAAISHAESLDSAAHRAYSYGNKALLLQSEKVPKGAVEYYQQAYSLFREEGLWNESARTLTNLAQAYFDIGRTKSAKRALLAAERIAQRHDLLRCRALLRILLGEIAKLEGQVHRAVRCWREAIGFSKKLHDQVVRFKAEFQLYRHALESGDSSLARSLERLLRRRATWVPHDVDELNDFKTLAPSRTRQRRNRVSSSQPH